ncbi:MAG: REP-associated tyrosine transposase [Puniceicoccaceae bacterium]
MGASYQWRRLSALERDEVLSSRKRHHYPWHSPPHRPTCGSQRYHVTAACFEHAHHFGRDPERMDAFAADLHACFREAGSRTFAWVLLPNHYHVLVDSTDVLALLQRLGKLHGRTSFQWNREENCRGRQIFCGVVEREIRSDRHFWSTINYILNNPVRHGYVERWTDWPWSNAKAYLEKMGRERAESIWREFPVRDYGAGWDDPSL